MRVIKNFRNDTDLVRAEDENNEAGFTLIELLMSILVSVILIGSLSLVVNSNSRLTQRGVDTTLANAFAENKIEELRSKGYLSLTNGTTDITAELPTELKNPRSSFLVVTEPSTGLKLVSLSVTYSDQGMPRTYSYKTYVGELGVGQY